MVMDELFERYIVLHEKGEVKNASLIAGLGITTIKGVKEELEAGNKRLAKIYIHEYERLLESLMEIEGDEKNE